MFGVLSAQSGQSALAESRRSPFINTFQFCKDWSYGKIIGVIYNLPLCNFSLASLTFIENHIVVCGWNDRAESIIETTFLLSNLPPKMILINELPEEQINSILDKFRKYKVKFVRGDYTRQAALERANVQNADAVILLPNLAQSDIADVDEKTILATLSIRSIAAKVKIIAFIMNLDNESHIKRAKVDEVFISDQFADYFIASHVIYPGLSNVLSQLLNPNTENLITLNPIPSKFKGKKIKELTEYYKNHHHFILLGVLEEVESVGLTDFLSSDTSQLDAFIERKLKEAGRTLGEESKVIVNLNPDEDYVIRENEKAIILK